MLLEATVHSRRPLPPLLAAPPAGEVRARRAFHRLYRKSHASEAVGEAQIPPKRLEDHPPAEYRQLGAARRELPGSARVGSNGVREGVLSPLAVWSGSWVSWLRGSNRNSSGMGALTFSRRPAFPPARLAFLLVTTIPKTRHSGAAKTSATG
jgi:hypothetical protein